MPQGEQVKNWDYMDFKGKQFPCRTLDVDDEGIAYHIVVSVQALADVLLDNDGIPLGKEEELVDNRIAYYFDNEAMFSRSDEELLEEIYS